MKNVFLYFTYSFFLLLNFGTTLNAQCRAGEILDSTKYKSKTEVLSIQYGGFTPPSLDIQINKNSTKPDITIYLDTFPLNCGSQSAKGTKILLKNNTNVEFLTGDINISERFYFYRTRSLNYLDSLNTNSNNSNQRYFWQANPVLIAQSRQIKADCSSGPFWDFNEFTSESKYIGLRFLEGSAYKYSWIEIKANATFDSATAIIKSFYSEELFTQINQDTLVLSPNVKGYKVLEDGIELQLTGLKGEKLTTSFMDFNGKVFQVFEPTVESDNATIKIPLQLPPQQQLYILSIQSEKMKTTLKLMY